MSAADWVGLGIIAFNERNVALADSLGMATTAEAEKLLGLSRLRTVAPIVRPDLHPDGRRLASLTGSFVPARSAHRIHSGR